MALDSETATAISALTVALKESREANGREHSEIKGALAENTKWSRENFNQLYDKSDQANQRLAKLETKEEASANSINGIGSKVGGLSETVLLMKPVVESLSNNSKWVSRLFVGAVIVQIIVSVFIVIRK